MLGWAVGACADHVECCPMRHHVWCVNVLAMTTGPPMLRMIPMLPMMPILGQGVLATWMWWPPWTVTAASKTSSTQPPSANSQVCYQGMHEPCWVGQLPVLQPIPLSASGPLHACVGCSLAAQS